MFTVSVPIWLPSIWQRAEAPTFPEPMLNERSSDKQKVTEFLKEINPENLLEGLMLKQKLQHFGHMMQRADSLEKTWMLRKIEGRKRRG